jgi:hypothetical protein
MPQTGSRSRIVCWLFSTFVFASAALMSLARPQIARVERREVRGWFAAGGYVSRGWYNAGPMTLVDATYELQSPLNEEQLRNLGAFANTYGLRRFRINDQNHLCFEYDASRLKDTEVAHVLRQANIPVVRKVMQ